MPIVRDPLDPKISFWHFLAYYLRFTREKEGLSLTQWGQIIGAARSTVSNMEAGRQKIHDDQVKLIDGKFGTGRLFELMLWYARTAHNPDWFRQYTQYEVDATVIRVYQGQIIPGPLHTEAYTRALLVASSAKDVESGVEARMKRQNAILNRPEPPFVWALIDELALYTEIGGSEVMKAQLQHLLDLAELPHISVRIIPRSAGAHLGVDGPFRIICLESRDIAYVGAQRGGRLIETPSEVKELLIDYDRIGQKAASDDASRALIQQRMETLP
jgi:hypothetical protein